MMSEHKHRTGLRRVPQPHGNGEGMAGLMKDNSSTQQAPPSASSHAYGAQLPAKAAAIPEAKEAKVAPAKAWSTELEHAIAFSAHVPEGAQWHPNQSEYISAAGGSVIIHSVKDTHAQTFLRGHTGVVNRIAVSPTGALIASAQTGKEPDIIVWSYKNKSALFRLQEHYSSVVALAFSDDERFLATVGDTRDRKLYIWDLQTGNIVASTQVPATTTISWGGRVKDVKGRPTPLYQLATTSDQLQQVLLWSLDPATGQIEAIKCRNGSIQRNFSCLQFSREGGQALAFAGTTSGDVAVFSVKAQGLQGTVPACAGGVRTLQVGKSGLLFVGGGDGSVQYFAPEEKDYILQQRVNLQSPIVSLSLSTDEKELLIATANGCIYRARTQDLKALLLSENHYGKVTTVQFPRGASDRFVTCSDDGTIRVWDATDYSVMVRASCKASPMTSLCLSDHCLTVGCEDGFIRSYHTQNGDKLWEIPNAHNGAVTALTCSNNQRFIVSGGAKGEVRVWDVKTRQMVAQLKEHKAAVTALAVYADDQTLISTSRDKSVLCWDLRTDKRVSAHISKLGSILDAKLSASEKLVLTVGQNRNITAWDLHQANPLVVIPDAHEGDVSCLARANNGKIFATGGADNTVCLWDAATFKCLATCSGHSGNVTALSFSHDDKQLVSVGEDQTILVWNVYSLS